MTEPVFFRKGKHASLVILHADDAPHLMRWINDPTIGRFLSIRHPTGWEAERKWLLARLESTSPTFGIWQNEPGRLVGTVAVHVADWEAHRNGVFGIMIGEAGAHGKGLGTETTRLILEYVFRHLGINAVELEVFKENAKAVRCYKKCGFRTIGTYKRWLVGLDGKRHDALIMTAHCNDWLVMFPNAIAIL